LQGKSTSEWTRAKGERRKGPQSFDITLSNKKTFSPLTEIILVYFSPLFSRLIESKEKIFTCPFYGGGAAASFLLMSNRDLEVLAGVGCFHHFCGQFVLNF
jgi:hypothetical protein